MTRKTPNYQFTAWAVEYFDQDRKDWFFPYWIAPLAVFTGRAAAREFQRETRVTAPGEKTRIRRIQIEGRYV